MSNQPDDSRRSTAYHEAGHAVMAVLLGRPIEKVTISPAHLQAGGSRLGVCKIQKGRTKPSKSGLEDEVLILLAGMVGEALATGRYNQAGAAKDLQMVQTLLTTNRATDDTRFQKLARRMLDKTEHLLFAPAAKQALRRVAQELMERETISGRAVRHFVDEAKDQHG